jgi:hypothetical protein
MKHACALALWLLSAACASIPRLTASVEGEAREFMTGYARELRAGERDAIAARYDSRGAYMTGGGLKTLASSDSIRAIYRAASWRPPSRFEWQDLSYEVLGPDAVLVTGRFDWTTGDGRTLPASYTALLVRRNGRLRIRAEHEDVAPSALRDRLCSR